MGEFEKCHICVGILDDLGSNFGINLHYFTINGCISPITLGLGIIEPHDHASPFAPELLRFP